MNELYFKAVLMSHMLAKWCNQAGKNLYNAFLKQVKYGFKKSHG